MKQLQLKIYLAKMDLTINDFAQLVECTPRYLSNIIHGRAMPGQRLAKDIEIWTNGEVKLITRHNLSQAMADKAANGNHSNHAQ